MQQSAHRAARKWAGGGSHSSPGAWPSITSVAESINRFAVPPPALPLPAPPPAPTAASAGAAEAAGLAAGAGAGAGAAAVSNEPADTRQ